MNRAHRSRGGCNVELQEDLTTENAEEGRHLKLCEGDEAIVHLYLSFQISLSVDSELGVPE